MNLTNERERFIHMNDGKAVFSRGNFELAPQCKEEYLKNEVWYNITVKSDILTYFKRHEDQSETDVKTTPGLSGNPDKSRPTDIPLEEVSKNAVANHNLNQNKTQLLITVGNCNNVAATALQGSFDKGTSSSDIAKKIIAVREKLVEDMKERYGVGK